MTGALAVYSAVFARYSMAITPKNYLLFGCHIINCSSQLFQGYRYLNYWNWGGREKQLAQQAKSGVETVKDKAVAAGRDAKDNAFAVGQAAKDKIASATK
jgi:hypothetical protein